MPSFRPYAAPLVLEPRSSRRLVVYLIVLHGLAAVVAVCLPWQLLWRLLLLCAILVSLLCVMRTHYWRVSRLAILRAIWDENGDWWLGHADGRALPASLRGDSLVTPWLVILLFTGAWRGVRAVLLLPDSLPQHILRRLRVRLRLYVRRDEEDRDRLTSRF